MTKLFLAFSGLTVCLISGVLLLTSAPSSNKSGSPCGPRPSTHGADREYRGFAFSDSVLHRSAPAQAGLDPEPINAFTRRMHGWIKPSAQDRLFPGAAWLIAHQGAVVARKATGDSVRYGKDGRELPPRKRERARPDTIYDLASVSKLFTAIVAVQQIESGKLKLHAPVARYLPAFASHGKRDVTVRDLLTHTSGLPATPQPPLWEIRGGIEARKDAILRSRPVASPGDQYLYSDLNMLNLQLVVEEVADRRLDTLVKRRITRPLGMRDTSYKPPADKRHRIAATSYQETPSRGLIRGAVHDSNAWAMKGVAGHSGVFSTVDDVAVLAQTLLNDGTYRGKRILTQRGVRMLQRDFNKKFPGDAHALGFELDQQWYMGSLSSKRALGHTGFTGTSLVIDRASRSFVILLSNRVHPNEETPSTNPARRRIAGALSEALPDRPVKEKPPWFAKPSSGTRHPKGRSEETESEETERGHLEIPCPVPSSTR